LSRAGTTVRGAASLSEVVPRSRLLVSLLFVIAVLGGAFVIAYRTQESVSAGSRDAWRTQSLLNEVLSARSDLADTLSAQHGYLLSAGAEPTQSAAYHMDRAQLDGRLTRAQQLAAARADDRRALDALVRLIHERLDANEAASETRAGTRMAQAREDPVTPALRIAFKEFQDSQERRLSEMDHSLSALTAAARLMWAATAVLVILASAAAFVYLHRQASSRRRAEVELRRTIVQQERVLFEISAMSTMMELLHICRSQAEANHVMGESLPQLLPSIGGGLYVMRSKGVLELQVSWGAGSMTKVFAPDDCWALRRSRTHLVERTRSAITCRHLEHPHDGYLCVPLVGHGEVLGVLHLASADQAAISDNVQRLAGVLAEQLSLALGNLRLQETLRSRSERDPLTDLYNRRHLELSAERELARAARHGYELSLIMLDVDHFKLFNDTNGHDAGDAVLRELAHVLRRHTRTEDIACRYGGEEFLLVLPGCPLDDAYTKAEAIREAIAQLRVTVSGAALSRVTASLGIASYPQHGTRLEELLRAADVALYKAKDAGRNQVVATSAPGDVMLFEIEDVGAA
jgi:diguanylate cyclase (GGDEF)-like protein